MKRSRLVNNNPFVRIGAKKVSQPFNVPSYYYTVGKPIAIVNDFNTFMLLYVRGTPTLVNLNVVRRLKL